MTIRVPLTGISLSHTNRSPHCHLSQNVYHAQNKILFKEKS
jgi:hypothetical protein